MVGIRNLGNVFLRKVTMDAVGQGAQFAGVNEQRLAVSIFLVPRKEPQTHRDLRAVKQLSRQGDHAIHQVIFDDGFADLAFARCIARHAPVRQHKSRRAVGRKMMDKMLHPRKVGIAHGRRTVLPAFVLPQTVPAPIAHVERRVGKDVIRFQVGMLVIVERVGGLLAQVPFDAANGKVHLCQLERVGVRFLSVHRKVADLPAVRLHELLALHEHPARSHSMGRTHVPYTGRASPPARAPPNAAYRTLRPCVPPGWRTATGNIHTPARAYPVCGSPRPRN